LSRSVDAAFFDLYGTLVELVVLEEACEDAAPGRGAELATRWRARQLEATWLLTCMGRWSDFDTVTREALGVAAGEMGLDAGPPGELAGAWARLGPRAGVTALLDRLAAAGIPAGVLSNGTGAMIRATLDGAGLAGRLAPLLSVDPAQVYKPAPAVYRLATEASGLPPERIGFVTANGWDAAGAAAFGLRVAWLRAPGGSLPAVGRLERPPAAVGIDEVAGVFGV
jgi:2-haloacid dehalogenase